jgi:hypothetical protein
MDWYSHRVYKNQALVEPRWQDVSRRDALKLHTQVICNLSQVGMLITLGLWMDLQLKSQGQTWVLEELKCLGGTWVCSAHLHPPRSAGSQTEPKFWANLSAAGGSDRPELKLS